MTGPAPLSNDAIDWQAITDSVNMWRGACIHCFTQAEAAITETLLALGEVRNTTPPIRTGNLFGQRVEALDKAIGPEGPFAQDGKAASAALASFRSIEGLRVHLAHGVGKISVDRKGKWLLVIRHTAMRSNKAELHERLIEQDGAVLLLNDLRRINQTLCSTLGNLRKTVAQ